MRRLGRIAVLSLLASLAACHGKQADTGKSAAAADILPGSASDAMIAYDGLKSQPPLAAPQPDGATDRSIAGVDGRTEDAAGSDTPPTDAVTTPAAAIAPSAETQP